MKREAFVSLGLCGCVSHCGGRHSAARVPRARGKCTVVSGAGSALLPLLLGRSSVSLLLASGEVEHHDEERYASRP